MNDTEFDPDDPKEKTPSILPLSEADASPRSNEAEVNDTEDVDSAMGALAEPAPVDPTSEDLEGSELDDTEDRDS